MKLIYRLAQGSFEALGLKQPPGKAYQMGYIDGYLSGFREARGMATMTVFKEEGIDFGIPELGEDEEPSSGAV